MWSDREVAGIWSPQCLGTPTELNRYEIITVQIEHSGNRVYTTKLLGSDPVRQPNNRNAIWTIQTVQFVRLAVLCTPCQIWSQSGIHSPFNREIDLLSVDNSSPPIVYVTKTKSLHILRRGYNQYNLKYWWFRNGKNFPNKRCVMHYGTLFLVNAPNVIWSGSCRHLIATVFGDTHRIE